MNTVISDANSDNARGWIFFDNDCPLCRAGRRRWGPLFERRGFVWVPLQSPEASRRLQLSDRELRQEMKLLLADGRIVGGARAWAVLFRSVWWLSPLGFLISLPGLRVLSRLIYQWIADHRYCFTGRCDIKKPPPKRQRHQAFLDLP